MTQIDLRHGGCGRACREILATLPDWFGIEASNLAYEADAETLPLGSPQGTARSWA